MHVHIIGIAGSMAAPLAIALKKIGHKVTGSDQDNIFPPFSIQLKKAKIPINQQQINQQIDLVIVGSSYKSFSRTREEFEKIHKLNIPYIPATKYLAETLAKKNSIIVAGSFGKTTTTAALAYCLKKQRLNPSYMFGGQAINPMPSLNFSNSNWSVIEGDESINGLDTKAKFLYYPIKYLILTSVNWEHKESYSTATDNLKAFQQLINRIPKKGLIVYNPQDKQIAPLLLSAKCPTIPYKPIKFKSQLIGDYNRENLGAVFTLCQELSLNTITTQKALTNFKGIKRRAEILFQNQNNIFIDDFSQSSERIETTLKTIIKHFPQKKLKVFYESHASFMQNFDSLKQLANALKLSSETVIYKLNFSAKNKIRLTAKDYLNNIPRSIYLPLSNDILNHYQKTLKKNEMLVHFSSGGQEGINIFKKVINYFKK